MNSSGSFDVAADIEDIIAHYDAGFTTALLVLRSLPGRDVLPAEYALCHDSVLQAMARNSCPGVDDVY